MSLMPSYTHERLKIKAVPKLGSGTDDHMAGATVQALNDWNNPHHLITAQTQHPAILVFMQVHEAFCNK